MTERPRLRPADVQSEHVGAAAEYLDRHHRFGRFGPSRHYLAWVSDRSYPPKALIARAIWEAGGAELEPDDFRGANNGPYYRRLEQLGFAILPIDSLHQGHRPSATAGTASRSGADRTPPPRAARPFSESDGGPAIDRSPPRAWTPAPVVGRWQLTRHHVFAAAAQCREWDPERDTDSYVLWVNGPWGKRYALSTLVRAALRFAGRGRRLRATYAWASPEVAHLRHLGFEVLPRGVRPVRRRFDNGMVKPSWINRETFERAVALFDAIPRYPARWRLDSSEVWSVGNRPYPLRALCLLLTHIRGAGWHEDWHPGPTRASWEARFREFGATVTRRGGKPDSDGRCARQQTEDLEDVARRVPNATMRARLIDARLGQGQYRRDLERHWGNACAVTGISLRDVLRASHAVAWRDCDRDEERIDPDNGLLLVANLDCLFDRGLISFASNGALLRSPRLSDEQARQLGLDRYSGLREDAHKALTPGRLGYLARHREKYGFPDDVPAQTAPPPRTDSPRALRRRAPVIRAGGAEGLAVTPGRPRT